MNKQTRNKAYPQEFREQVVKLVQAGGQTVSEIAREFEISTDSVRRWLKQAERDAGSRQVRSGDRFDSIRIFEFVRAHQARYPITCQCRVPGSLDQRVLRVAPAAAQPPGASEPGLEPGDRADPRAVAGDLRGAACAGAAASGRVRRVAAAGSAADAGRRPAGGDPAAGNNHRPGPAGHGGGRPGPAGVPRRRAQPAVGGGEKVGAARVPIELGSTTSSLGTARAAPPKNPLPRCHLSSRFLNFETNS